ncbi:MAG: NAD(+)--rifampin ADP-ribosyltransferase [Bacteroidetes bacterium]|nr:NAD(+)--rifampin ADP-ribosyltransferase [Bacteroidota bacterium]
MKFSPFNDVVKLCLQGMEMEEQKKTAQAIQLFFQAWNEASDDFEKFLAAYYLSRQQNSVSEKLKWLSTSLLYAKKVNDPAAQSAFPALYLSLAKCYEDLGDQPKAKEYHELAKSFQYHPGDKGPFYHGTKAQLEPGELLKAGGQSNYKSEVKMNHIYFTALVNGAGLAAALAKGEGREHVYVVEPTGEFENDPNLTDKKFPGNPTRSYRSEYPLKIVGEVSDWNRPGPESIQKYREKLSNNTGEIIN